MEQQVTRSQLDRRISILESGDELAAAKQFLDGECHPVGRLANILLPVFPGDVLGNIPLPIQQGGSSPSRPQKSSKKRTKSAERLRGLWIALVIAVRQLAGTSTLDLPTETLN